MVTLFGTNGTEVGSTINFFNPSMAMGAKELVAHACASTTWFYDLYTELILTTSNLSMRSHTLFWYLVNILSCETYCLRSCLTTFFESPKTCKIFSFFWMVNYNPWTKESYLAYCSYMETTICEWPNKSPLRD